MSSLTASTRPSAPHGHSGPPSFLRERWSPSLSHVLAFFCGACRGSTMQRARARSSFSCRPDCGSHCLVSRDYAPTTFGACAFRRDSGLSVSLSGWTGRLNAYWCIGRVRSREELADQRSALTSIVSPTPGGNWTAHGDTNRNRLRLRPVRSSSMSGTRPHS